MVSNKFKIFYLNYNPFPYDTSQSEHNLRQITLTSNPIGLVHALAPTWTKPIIPIFQLSIRLHMVTVPEQVHNVGTTLR